MQFSLETLAALATIFGAVVSVLALVESRAWLVLTSLFFVCLSLCGGFYARRERLNLKNATITIEGHSIDSLNIANLKRRVNRTLLVQEAHHTARIKGGDLKVEWTYAGYCRANKESAMEFSIDSERTTSFAQMNCVAYDLSHDPAMKHEIYPVLVGASGVSKKISIPLLETLRRNQPFRVMLRCTLPRCLTAGFGYYTATLSFAQDRVHHCSVRLIFTGSPPSWMRVYDCSPHRPPTLVKTLVPCRQEPGLSEYLDVIEETEGQSARVYGFWRDEI